MTTASGSRYRLVHVQGGREHVSSVVLSRDEVAEHLHAEAVLHQATGWAVYEEPGALVVALRPGVRREVYARSFDPMGGPMRFGDYTERWEAEAVARAFRARGLQPVKVVKIHATKWIVMLP